MHQKILEMIARLTLLFILVIIAISIALLSLPTSAPRVVSPDFNHSPNDNNQPLQSSISLTDTTLDWGLYVHHQQTSNKLTALTETLGSGVCAFDANNDGWIDLLFVGGGGHTRHYGRKSWWHKQTGDTLLINHQGLSLINMTEDSGLKPSHWGMGCAATDFDRDGRTDLIVTGIAKNFLYKNIGNGKFKDVTEKSGISSELWSTGAALADFNNDGLTDIYLSNYIKFKKDARTFERMKGFETSDVAFDASLYDPLPNKLYVNLGNFTFREVSQEMGVANSFGRSLGANWLDLNHDGWLDLLVLNDDESPSQVFINQKGLNFTRIENKNSLLESSGVHNATSYSPNSNKSTSILFSRSQGHAPVVATPSNLEMPSSDAFNPPEYNDTSWQLGIADQSRLYATGWGVVNADLNNDGLTDFYLANGSTKPDMDSQFIPQGQPNYLLIGNSDGKFLAQSTDANEAPLSSRGAITADLNNDGLLELIVSNNNGPLQILESATHDPGNWIGLNFSSKDRFDRLDSATIIITIGEQVTTKVAHPNPGFLSQSDSRFHIGLGPATKIDKLQLLWPDKSSSTFSHLTTNHYYNIEKTSNTIQLAQIENNSQFVKYDFNKLNGSEKILLAKYLIRSETPNSLRGLISIWNSTNHSEKIEIFNLINTSWNIKFLTILKKSLNSEFDDLRIKAIDFLSDLELEPSLYWLIPLLNDKNPEVQCKTASAFEHFFTEEEAITHRKNLAIAPLIRALDSNNQSATLCFLQALGKAEHKRASLPLIKLIKENRNEAVTVAAIEALGLIRDSMARNSLLDIVSQNHSYTPRVTAAALIALSRIGDKNVESYFLNRSKIKSHANKLYRIELLNNLLKVSDGIVIGREKLINQLKTLTSQYFKPTFDKSSLNHHDIATLLESIKQGKLEKNLHFSQSYLKHSDSEIRTAAYLLLIEFNQTKKNLLQHLLTRESSLFIENIISHQPLNSIDLTTEDIDTLIIRVKKNELTISSLLNYLPKLSQESRYIVITSLIDIISDTDENAIISECKSLDRNQFKHSNNLIIPHNSRKKYVHTTCFFNSRSIESTPQNLNLKHRIYLKEIIDSNNYSDEEKYRLLITASQSDEFIARNFLKKNFDSVPPQLLSLSIEALAPYSPKLQLKDSMWLYLKDTNQSAKIRLAAALYLLEIDQDKVINYIEHGFFNHAIH